MKALLLSQYRQLKLTDVPVPEPGPDEILMRVAACGICGSDVHGYDGSSGRRIPPIVMGHEAAGTVAAVGKNVRGLTKGNRITVDSTVYCGQCAPCLRGEVNLCDRRQVLGVSCGDYRRAGAFAEFVVVPSRIVYRLPEILPFEEAALLEAVSVALHAVSMVSVRPQDHALVVGAGMIGLLIVQALHAAGCSHIYVADVDQTRLKRADQFGVATSLLAGPSLIQQVMEITTGNGMDVVIEAVGINGTISSAIDSVRKGGSVVLVGNVTPEVTLPLQKVVSRQLRLQGSCASSGEYPRAIELMSSEQIRVKPLISAIAPLHEGPRWFERLYAREPNLMKVVLTPGAE